MWWRGKLCRDVKSSKCDRLCYFFQVGENCCALHANRNSALSGLHYQDRARNVVIAQCRQIKSVSEDNLQVGPTWSIQFSGHKYYYINKYLVIFFSAVKSFAFHVVQLTSFGPKKVCSFHMETIGSLQLWNIAKIYSITNCEKLCIHKK